jgi:hypothetical protein
VTMRYSGRVHRIEDARVRAGGVTATTGRDGTARLRLRGARPGPLRLVATKHRLDPGRTTLRAVRH